MNFWRRPSEIDLLAAFWNEYVASGASQRPEIASSRDTQQLDPTLTETVGWLTAADDAQPPDPAFLTRLEQTLMESAQTMQPVWQPLPNPAPPNSNGRIQPSVPVARPKHRPRQTDRRWVLASFAVALLVVLSGIGSYFAFVPPEHRFFGGGGTNGVNVIPAATPSPIPDVPMYRGNPTRDGVMPGPGPAGDPVELWKTPLQGRITTSVALSNGVIFARTENGVLGAFDAATGDELWTVETGGTEETWPTAANGLVYIGIEDGTLSAYDATSGDNVWSYDAGGRSAVTEPIDGVLYGSSTGGVAFAIDARTSEQLWRTQVTSESLRGPAMANGVLYFTSSSEGGAVFALDQSSGTLLWTHTLGGYDLVPTPSFSDGRVYLVPREDARMTGAVIALDGVSGDEVWRFTAEDEGSCTVPTIVDGRVFVRCMQGYSYALDAATGSQIWVYHSTLADPAQLGANQEYADGVVYQPDDMRTIVALEGTTGTELWRFEVDGFLGEMSISGGSIFFGTGNGSLYAIGGTNNPSATPASSPAPATSPSAALSTDPVQFVRTIEQPGGEGGEPSAVGFDSDGNMVVIETSEHRIVRIAADGTVGTIYGDASGPGILVQPNSVAFDADGNAYVGDPGRNAIVKFDPDGGFLLTWGNTGTGDGQLDEPLVGGIDAQERLWVLEAGNHRVQLFDVQGQHLLTFGGFGSAPGQFNHPQALTLDSDGNAYVTECDNRRVSKFAPDGTFLLSWDHDFLCLAGIAIDDEHGIVYVSDADQQRIQAFDLEGNFLTMWGEAGDGDGQFTAPTVVTLDGRGHVLVTDIATGRISEFKLLPPLWPEATPVARI